MQSRSSDEPLPRTPSNSDLRSNPVHTDLIEIEVEDGELPIQHKRIMSPPPFTPSRPAQIKIKTEEFEKVHNTRESDAKADVDSDEEPPLTAISSILTSPVIPEPLHSNSAPGAKHPFVKAYEKMHSKKRMKEAALEYLHQREEQGIETDWNESDEDNDTGNWLESKPDSPQSNVFHPPDEWHQGEHPGMGWEINDPFAPQYYPFPIPDPLTNRLIIAPYVSYAIDRKSVV